MRGFFRNIGRIADALERLATQRAPQVETPAPVFDAEAFFDKQDAWVRKRIEQALSEVAPVIVFPEGKTEPVMVHPLQTPKIDPVLPVERKPEAPTPSTDGKRLSEEDLILQIKALMNKGVDTYSGLSTALTKAGFTNRNGNKFWPAGVRAVMLKHNIRTTLPSVPAPAPAPVRPQRVETPIVREADAPKDVSLPFEDLLSPRVAARARIVRDYRTAGGKGVLSADEISAIEAFKANKGITQCPPCTDSTGYDHLAGAKS